METIKIDRKNTKMVAHRGAGKVWVENSLPAFQNSAKCSYWGIETDIHCTKDGKYIIIHDDTTDRVTGENYTVEETDFETLRNLKLLGLEGDEARLPTLEEYVNACKSGDKYCVLELKNRMPEENVKEIIEQIEAMEYLDHTVFISFSHTNICTIKKLRPNQPAQYLIGRKTPEVKLAQVREEPVDIDIDRQCITKELIDEMHALGVKVNSWTVNEPEQATEFVNLGIDFITTDILE
jgi:glycerophosphoryl diester phosphodiesterase